ncbi:hypothetical protein THF1C08_260023 [Vibrio jasicida]|uniref:Uncharacterized protein n=1 Tax=Vibrio jasicida TaxID=766224 RepID=A0AAU9QQJ9_9VIBR|nr:hypothetical protein THF1C08_260023 [Vibrio jasicida]CAH1596502.1 hypothetical protein THF1A12_300008 [Vibrio jasicida]
MICIAKIIVWFDYLDMGAHSALSITMLDLEDIFYTFSYSWITNIHFSQTFTG